jgi:acetoin utilization protein AcuB
MASALVTIPQSTPVLSAWDLMRARRIRHLPVLDGARRLAGMVTERDLRQAILERALPPPGSRAQGSLDTLRVDRVMIRGVLTVHPDIGVREAAELMRTHGLGALPVARERRVVGLVTATDLIRALTGRRTRRRSAARPSGRRSAQREGADS